MLEPFFPRVFVPPFLPMRFIPRRQQLQGPSFEPKAHPLNDSHPMFVAVEVACQHAFHLMFSSDVGLQESRVPRSLQVWLFKTRGNCDKSFASLVCAVSARRRCRVQRSVGALSQGSRWAVSGGSVEDGVDYGR